MVPQLINLRNRVNLLVEDGLVFKVSSETIRNLYASLDTSLQQAAEGIKSFATMFNDIEAGAKDFDDKIKAALPG